MREDFDKILVERPRLGHSMKYHAIRRKLKKKGIENCPLNEGMRSIHKKVGRNYKELNENLSPLYRFLNRQVGRPWNDIYSEIKQMTGKNPNAVKNHILQHLEDWYGVTLRTTTVDGKRMHRSLTRYGKAELHDGALYIDDEGILRKYKRKPKVKEDKNMKIFRVLPNGNQAHKINGVWFLVILSPIEEKHICIETYESPSLGIVVKKEFIVVRDVFGTRGARSDFIKKYGKLVYASHKKTMNKDELESYDLKND